MEDLLLLKQFINQLSKQDILELMNECEMSWLADIAFQWLATLLLLDESFAVKILPLIQQINKKIKKVINLRKKDNKIDTGML